MGNSVSSFVNTDLEKTKYLYKESLKEIDNLKKSMKDIYVISENLEKKCRCLEKIIKDLETSNGILKIENIELNDTINNLKKILS